MRVALIFNPRSGRGRPKGELLDRVLSEMAKAAMEVDVYPTEAPGHATEIAARASRARVDCVVGWGGDGTLNEVASGLLGTRTPMGVLPGGTVNVFAREVGIPRSIQGAIEVLTCGEVTQIPVGMAGERPFLAMAGVGLDAEIAYRVKGRFKDALGVTAFWLDGFRKLASYEMTPLRVRSDGRELVGTGLVAGKLRRYGPRYFITPEARVEEPLLHVVLFQGENRRDYLRYMLGVMTGVHLRFSDVKNWKASALAVESEGKVAYQLDGEAAGFVPVTFTVRENGLSVVLPPRTTC
jgi:YegS/Rv2252/BmrU family lipid kinase